MERYVVEFPTLAHYQANTVDDKVTAVLAFDVISPSDL